MWFFVFVFFLILSGLGIKVTQASLNRVFCIFFCGLALFDHNQGRVMGIWELWECSRKSQAHSPFGDPTSTPAALAGHSQNHCSLPFLPQACLFSSYFYSANCNVLPNGSPSLLLFAKTYRWQPRKPNYITRIGVSCRKQNIPIQDFSELLMSLRTLYRPGQDPCRVSQSHLTKGDFFEKHL